MDASYTHPLGEAIHVKTYLSYACLALFAITSSINAADAKVDIAKKLKATNVTFNFVDASLAVAIKEFSTQTNVTLTIDPAIPKTNIPILNLRVAQMPADAALDWILKLVELEMVIGNKAIFISTPEGIKEATKVKVN